MRGMQYGFVAGQVERDAETACFSHKTKGRLASPVDSLAPHEALHLIPRNGYKLSFSFNVTMPLPGILAIFQNRRSPIWLQRTHGHRLATSYSESETSSCCLRGVDKWQER